MLINYLDFSEFYDRLLAASKRQRYQVIISLVARHADAKDIYGEIIDNWSSFYDLGGRHIAFVFAGEQDPRECDPCFEKLPESHIGINRPPKNVLLTGFTKIDLDVHEVQPFFQRQRSAPDASRLIDNHSSRISDLKDTLNIDERDVPCLHFLFTDTRSGLILPLSNLNTSLYRWFKQLLSQWDSIFRELDSQEKKEDKILFQREQARNEKNSSSGPARAQLNKLMEWIKMPGDPSFLSDALKVVETIQHIPADSSHRDTAFSELRKLKNDYPHIDRKIFSAFNAMIDMAPRLEEKVKVTAQRNIDYTDIDQRLYQVLKDHLAGSSSDGDRPEPRKPSVALPRRTPPLKAFISYSRFDGESNKEGINFLEEFKSHLATLTRFNGLLQTWDDTSLVPGELWDDAIKEELQSADIIFLLISHHFLNTRYITDNELVIAIERHKRKECIVVPVILSECGWQDIPMLSALNGIPRKGHTIASWRRIPTGAQEIVHGTTSIKRSGHWSIH